MGRGSSFLLHVHVLLKWVCGMLTCICNRTFPLPPPSTLFPLPTFDQAEKDRAKALEHELEGARAIIEVAIDYFMVLEFGCVILSLQVLKAT